MTERFRILHSNILYGGIELENHSETALVLDWLRLHYLKLIAKNEAVFKDRLNGAPSFVERLITKYDSDIFMFTEAMPFLDRTVDMLERYGYYSVMGMGEHVKPPLTNAVVIASKTSLVEQPLTMPDQAGSGSVGAYIPEINMLVFSAHPSAFNPLVRAKQLRAVAQQIKAYQDAAPDAIVVLAGDLNTERVLPHFSQLGLKHLTAKTFPSDRIFTILRKKRWTPLRLLMGVMKQRSIDHIFVSPNINAQLTAIETNSDHKALLLEAELNY